MKSRIFSAFCLLAMTIIFGNGLISWKQGEILANPADIEKAVNNSLAILQKSGYKFINGNRLKCASCHHNTLLSMVASKAKEKGFTLVDSFTQHRIEAMNHTLKEGWNVNMPDQFITAKFIGPYLLLGMYGEQIPPNLYTDIAVDYMIRSLQPGGSFKCEAMRVPLESGEAHLASLTIRAIQLYASPSQQGQVKALVDRSRPWLENLKDEGQQEIVFQLLGMYWCGSAPEKIAEVAKRLEALQQPDGGWAQLKGMRSDAYATGQALYALNETHMLEPDQLIYQKGLAYLLRTQDASGAWIVETRSYPIQPFFNSDFPPYDENQFISAAGTSWAVMAMINALPDKAIH